VVRAHNVKANNCDVCVIIRTLDRPVFLQRALESVIRQTLPPAELVVVDLGARSADVGRACEQAAGRIRFECIRAGRLSRGAALNAGLQVATAKWYAVLDDDDTWSPDFLARMTAAELGSAGGVACRTEVVEERVRPDGTVEERARRIFNRDFEVATLADMAAANQFTINAAILRRDIWESLGGYREDLPALEDWEFNLRYLARTPIMALPDALACYHRRPATAGRLEANSEERLHVEARRRLVDEWLRKELATGCAGFGTLALAAEGRANSARVLRFVDRIQKMVRWWRRGGS